MFAGFPNIAYLIREFFLGKGITMHDFLALIAPYIGVFGFLFFTLILPIILWGRSVSEQLRLIRDNDLKHIEMNTGKANDLLVRLVTIAEMQAGVKHDDTLDN